VEEEKRLNELFEELEEISDSVLKKKLNKIEKIEPSDTFRTGLFAKIEKAKWLEGFLDGLMIPKFRWPVIATAGGLLFLTLIAGIESGFKLNTKEEKPFKNPTELSLSEFGSDYPTNSLQQWVVNTTLNAPEE
jgi:hypothetical protein